jgi:hypothetical protein
MPGRETRGLLLKVGLTAGLLVLLARWVGSPAGGPRRTGAPEAAPTAGRSAPGTEAAAPIEASTVDLSFYSSLDTTPGRGGSPSLAGRLARDAEDAAGATGSEGGAWVVQALATRDGARARRTRDRLAAAGLPAVLIEARAAGQPVYRVRVGRYADRPVAESLARRLKKDYGLESWVLKEGE